MKLYFETDLSALPVFTVVSGLPRSGTSLMMRILDDSGFTCVVDEGSLSYESHAFASSASLCEVFSGLPLTMGLAAKIVAPTVIGVPLGPCRYKILWMHRDVGQIVESISKAQVAFGLPPSSQSETVAEFEKVSRNTLLVLRQGGPKVELQVVEFAELVTCPEAVGSQLSEFLGRPIDTRAAVKRDPAKVGQFGLFELEGRA